MSQLADRIKAERLRLGLSQETLADRANVTQGAIQKIEAGRRTPNVLIVADVAVALGVAMDWLVLGEGPKKRRFLPLDYDDVKSRADAENETGSRSLEDRLAKLEENMGFLEPLVQKSRDAAARQRAATPKKDRRAQ